MIVPIEELLHELDYAAAVVLHGGYDEQTRNAVVGTLRDAHKALSAYRLNSVINLEGA